MRITALFLAMMMALFLTACSGDNDSGKAAASGDKASTSAPAKAYNPDDDQDGDC